MVLLAAPDGHFVPTKSPTLSPQPTPWASPFFFFPRPSTPIEAVNMVPLRLQFCSAAIATKFRPTPANFPHRQQSLACPPGAAQPPNFPRPIWYRDQKRQHTSRPRNYQPEIRSPLLRPLVRRSRRNRTRHPYRAHMLCLAGLARDRRSPPYTTSGHPKENKNKGGSHLIKGRDARIPS